MDISVMNDSKSRLTVWEYIDLKQKITHNLGIFVTTAYYFVNVGYRNKAAGV